MNQKPNAAKFKRQRPFSAKVNSNSGAPVGVGQFQRGYQNHIAQSQATIVPSTTTIAARTSQTASIVHAQAFSRGKPQSLKVFVRTRDSAPEGGRKAKNLPKKKKGGANALDFRLSNPVSTQRQEANFEDIDVGLASYSPMSGFQGKILAASMADIKQNGSNSLSRSRSRSRSATKNSSIRA